jgi:hypothetical protein
MQRAALTLLASVVAAASLGGCGRARADAGAAPVGLEQHLGVRVESVRRTAGGYMLDFRFRVVDQERAHPLFDRDVKPYVHHLKSGAKLLVPSSPKIGPMRSRTGGPTAPVSFVIFANPARLVSPGDQVAVVVGKVRSAPLTVQ